jgi:hypothetical protein
MNHIRSKTVLCSVVLMFGLIASTACGARGFGDAAGRGGDFNRGVGQYYHNNDDWHGNQGYYQGNNGHNSYYGGWVGGGPGVVVGVPFGGYYAPSCQTIQTCNSAGVCSSQQYCN